MSKHTVYPQIQTTKDKFIQNNQPIFVQSSNNILSRKLARFQIKMAKSATITSCCFSRVFFQWQRQVEDELVLCSIGINAEIANSLELKLVQDFSLGH